MKTAYRTQRKKTKNFNKRIKTVQIASHVSLFEMKYNFTQLIKSKISTKMRAAMLSIMILSTSTDSGWKQVGEEAAGVSSPRQLTLKKEFGSEFSLLTSKSVSIVSFPSTLFWLWGCLACDSSISTPSISNILISSLAFLLVCLTPAEFPASTWMALAGGGGGRFTVGWTSLASLSCSLKAKTETMMTASSARRDGMKISDISTVRANENSSSRPIVGWRQEGRSSVNTAARIIRTARTSLEMITAF